MPASRFASVKLQRVAWIPASAGMTEEGESRLRVDAFKISRLPAEGCLIVLFFAPEEEHSFRDAGPWTQSNPRSLKETYFSWSSGWQYIDGKQQKLKKGESVQ